MFFSRPLPPPCNHPPFVRPVPPPGGGGGDSHKVTVPPRFKIVEVSKWLHPKRSTLHPPCNLPTNVVTVPPLGRGGGGGHEVTVPPRAGGGGGLHHKSVPQYQSASAPCTNFLRRLVFSVLFGPTEGFPLRGGGVGLGAGGEIARGGGGA